MFASYFFQIVRAMIAGYEPTITTFGPAQSNGHSQVVLSFFDSEERLHVIERFETRRHSDATALALQLRDDIDRAQLLADLAIRDPLF